MYKHEGLQLKPTAFGSVVVVAVVVDVVDVEAVVVCVVYVEQVFPKSHKDELCILEHENTKYLSMFHKF